tara:strand:- start:10219 stop:10878 length:660 start_codon:yes stop_codon:yes gene_type:complete
LKKILKFYNSTIGKKLVVATTGILFSLFLAVHFVNNLIVFAGRDVFNKLVTTLEAVRPLIIMIEIVLGIIVILHVYNSIQLNIKNRKKSFEVKNQSRKTSFFSNYMVVSGSIIFIFMSIHLSTFWFNFRDNHEHNYYYLVTSSAIGFGNIFITILYLVSMILLGAHLKHGYQSALQTFGIRNTRIGNILFSISAIFWLFIPGGFFFIAFWFGILRNFLL